MSTINNNKKNATVTTNKNNGVLTLAQSIVASGRIQMQMYGYDWFQAWIPVSLIETEVPYQRPLNPQRVKEIIKKFDNAKVGSKLVNYRPDEDKFYLMDGKHTITALKAVGKEYLPCHVFIDEPYEREAQIFAEQYDDCVKVNTKDTFHANCEAKEESHMIILQVLNDFGVELVSGNVGLRKVRSVQKLKAIMKKYGEDGLRFVFQLIEDAGWGATDGKAYVESTLNIGFYAYPECLKKNGKINKTKYNYLIKILKKYPTSTRYAIRGYEYCETTTKHPESAIKYVIREDLQEAQMQCEKMAAYHRNYYKEYVKVVK